MGEKEEKFFSCQNNFACMFTKGTAVKYKNLFKTEMI